MQIGLGLYRHQLTPDNFRFANQLGAEQIVVHLENYLAAEADGKVSFIARRGRRLGPRGRRLLDL